MIMDNAKTRQPTLFVGLGGKGGRIVNRIATILSKREDWPLMEKTMQFFAIDTDKSDLDNCTSIPQAHRFTISGFDKGLWVADKLGRSGLSKPEEDPRVAQWVHDWYNFRSSQGAGAGQIRIESRVSLYNSLESSNLINRLEKAILDTIDMQNSMLSYEVKKFNVFIYYTVAGGTGSGAHLMFAAFLRHLIGNFGWSANITGVSMLSTLVAPLIRNMRQREDILANGYSAMKEDEHLMRLKVFSDMRDPRNRREFIYHPFIASTEVDASPFDFLYVLDANPEVHIENWDISAADGIYLQLFSPIFGVRNSDYDNFEKNQKRLARGMYSTFYGSYGCSVLLLPDKDLARYCLMRKTADLINEQLLADITLNLSTGPKSYRPTTEELNNHDIAGQTRLWDERFFDYMRDRIEKVENTRPAQIDDDEGLKAGARALKSSGFALSPTLKPLRDIVEKIGSDRLSDDEISDLRKLILPVAKIDELPGVGEDADPLPAPIDYRANLESFLLNFRDFGETVAGTVYIDDANGRKTLKPGLFRGFWDHLDKSYLETAFKSVAYQHRMTDRGESTKEGNLEDILGLFEDNILDNVRQLGAARERIKRATAEFRSSLGRKFVMDFLAENRKSFEIQRLFLITQQHLSQGFNGALTTILAENSVESAERELNNAVMSVRADTALAGAARTTIGEHIDEIRRGSGAVDFSQRVKQLDYWVRTICTRYATVMYLQFLHDIHEHLGKVMEEMAGTFRLFSEQAEHEINEIKKAAKDFCEHPGGQADEYHNDVEALQDFGGHRMWEEYYEWFVRNSVQIPEKEIHKIIAAVFSDARLVEAKDQIDAIRNQMSDLIRKVVEQRIVGKYTDGKENRGLSLQGALEAEAYLMYRKRLEATGRWDDNTKKNWETIATRPTATLHSRSEKDLAEDMRKFARDHLESKIAVSVRRSAIMANIAMQDAEVTCKQAIVCYDEDLYGKQKPDSDTLGFPSLVKKIAPEFMPESFAEYGKMVIFYQAVLGVPPFVFRNLVTSMRESYNKRVRERDWSRPLHGRQYPLHIDRNWEPGDPGVDESKLPLSLDPDEALVANRMTNSERSRFFAYWYAFFRAGHIVREEGRGFLVPSGKLGNSGPDIILGRTAREAILAMMRAHTAHSVLEEAFNQADPIDQEVLAEQRDRCLSLMGGDAWGREEPDPEIRELADLLAEHLAFREAEEAEEKRRRLHAESYNSCIGKED
jgi:hypothetical protein